MKTEYALLAAMVFPCVILAGAVRDDGAVTYTKPIDRERQVRKDDDVTVSRAFHLRLEGRDGHRPPVEDIRRALERADKLTITNLFIPAHACDMAADCEREVHDTCVEHEAGGRDLRQPVILSWNSATGQGTCTGKCANGGTVEVTCSER